MSLFKTTFNAAGAHNYTIKINYIKAKIDNTQQNSKCRLCGDRNETVNYIRNLARKGFKTKYDWVGKIILWELWKRLRFNHATKWCLQKPESVQENETHWILLDFDIQMYHPIPTRRPDLMLINKKKRTCQRAKKAVEWEGDDDTSYSWRARNSSQILGKKRNWKLEDESRL